MEDWHSISDIYVRCSFNVPVGVSRAILHALLHECLNSSNAASISC